MHLHNDTGCGVANAIAGVLGGAAGETFVADVEAADAELAAAEAAQAAWL